VLKETTNKLFGRHGTADELSRGHILVLKGDVAVREREDAVVADGHTKDIRGEIFEGVLATADWLAIHNPALLPYVFLYQRTQWGLVQLVSELGPEEHGEGRDVDEEVCTGCQPVAVSRKSSAGDDVMHVGMVAQVTRPGMKHPDHLDPASDEASIPGQSLHRL